MKIITRICALCGVDFYSGSNNGTYCSELCNIMKWVAISPSGCFECSLVGPYGYSAVISKKTGRNVKAHRHVYETTWGAIPAEMDVCHTCDNPPCVRPDHLFVGSKYENKLDSIKKGRWAFGTRMGTNVLSEDQVLAVRADPRMPTIISAEYGITATTVASIKRKRIWKWLPGPEPVIRPSSFATSRPRQ
jgi:HNH endonuclease